MKTTARKYVMKGKPSPSTGLSHMRSKVARTMLRTAIASRPPVRETALLISEAVPASSSPTEFITVVVSGATVMAMPRLITRTAGK